MLFSVSTCLRTSVYSDTYFAVFRQKFPTRFLCRILELFSASPDDHNRASNLFAVRLRNLKLVFQLLPRVQLTLLISIFPITAHILTFPFDFAIISPTMIDNRLGKTSKYRTLLAESTNTYQCLFRYACISPPK